MRTVGFGVIGCGNIGPTHAEATSQVPGAQLVAVSDVRLARARKLAEQYGAIAYSDYRRLLDCPDVQAVCLCVPSGMRLEVALECIAAGKHVLCEKPLEVTTARADRIIQAAEDAGVILACVFQSRFTEAARLVKQAVEQGRFGRLVLGNAYVKWFRSAQYYKSAAWRGTRKLDGGGCLMNQGIHMIDLLLWLLGNPRSVQAVTRTVAHRGLEVEDLATATIEFVNGAIGTIEGSTAIYPGRPAQVGIYGNQGSVVIEDGQIVSWDFLRPWPAGQRKARALMGQESQVGSASGDPMKNLKIGGHALVIKDLVQAILYGRQPFVPGCEGRRAVALIEAIYKSAAHGGRLVRL